MNTSIISQENMSPYERSEFGAAYAETCADLYELALQDPFKYKLILSKQPAQGEPYKLPVMHDKDTPSLHPDGSPVYILHVNPIVNDEGFIVTDPRAYISDTTNKMFDVIRDADKIQALQDTFTDKCPSNITDKRSLFDNQKLPADWDQQIANFLSMNDFLYEENSNSLSQEEIAVILSENTPASETN
jgi:hypothetical protein